MAEVEMLCADAAVEAAVRADEMRDDGDVDGARVRQRIADAFDHLQAETPAEGRGAIESEVGTATGSGQPARCRK